MKFSLTKCLICGKEFTQLSSAHTNTHGISWDDYKEKFNIQTGSYKERKKNNQKLADSLKTPEDYRKCITDIFNSTQADGLIYRLKSMPSIWNVVEEWCSEIKTSNGMEKVYLYMNEMTKKPVCSCGSGLSPTFDDIFNGYRQFCSSQCSAAIALQVENRMNTLNKNGGCGMANPETKGKILKTLFENHGVTNASHTEAHKTAMSNLSPEVIKLAKEKNKKTCMQLYNRQNSSQRHWSDETYNTIMSKTEMKELYRTMTIQEMAQKLSVHTDTILNYLSTHQLREKFISNSQRLITEFVKELVGPDLYILMNSRSIIHPLELDIVIKEPYNVAIEVCGLYWHREDDKGKEYHRKKLNLTNTKNYDLLTIYDDEWIFSKDLVKNRIREVLKIPTRHLTLNDVKIVILNEEQKSNIRVLSVNKPYLSTIVYGVECNNEIIATMGFTNQDSFWTIDWHQTDGSHIEGYEQHIYNIWKEKFKPNCISIIEDHRFGRDEFIKTLSIKKQTIIDPMPDKIYNHWSERNTNNGVYKGDIYDCGKTRYIV
jgi:hypothetical protein